VAPAAAAAAAAAAAVAPQTAAAPAAATVPTQPAATKVDDSSTVKEIVYHDSFADYPDFDFGDIQPNQYITPEVSIALCTDAESRQIELNKKIASA